MLYLFKQQGRKESDEQGPEGSCNQDLKHSNGESLSGKSSVTPSFLSHGVC